MLVDVGFDSDSKCEESGRLKEKDVSSTYHWMVSEDQRADVLTKRTLLQQRRDWLSDNNWIALRTTKRGDAVAMKAIPSRPRAKLDKSLASLVLTPKEVAAKVAGFNGQSSSTSTSTS